MVAILKLSDLIVMKSKHTISYIFHKNLITGLPVSKALIKYNRNKLEENNEDEKRIN